MRVASLVGARPNFIKLAPLARELARRPAVEHTVIHTGQHYDPEMSDAFFAELEIPRPECNLGVGSGTHATQTAGVMLKLEPIFVELRPDVVLLYGDVNSTLAGALTAGKLGLPIGHIEAGLRSGDWSMPEELNRVVTDRLSALCFAPSRDALENLASEGVAAERVHFVGNVMIDTLCWALPRARALGAPARHGVASAPYAVVTLHRPANVDDPAVLGELLAALEGLGSKLAVLFPLHPRTRQRLQALDSRSLSSPQLAAADGLRLLEPLGYLEMLSLVADAHLVITDSGGLQEETTFLGVPCLTVRPNTERPVTCIHGTNRLVRPRREAILAAAERALGRRSPARPMIERWDGRAAERIAQVLCDGESFCEIAVAPAQRLAAAPPALEPSLPGV